MNVVFFVLGGSSASEFCADVWECSIFSLFIGHLNKKDNWDKMVGIFIQVKVCLKRSVGQSEGGGRERGHDSKGTVWRATAPKWRHVVKWMKGEMALGQSEEGEP